MPSAGTPPPETMTSTMNPVHSENLWKIIVFDPPPETMNPPVHSCQILSMDRYPKLSKRKLGFRPNPLIKKNWSGFQGNQVVLNKNQVVLEKTGAGWAGWTGHVRWIGQNPNKRKTL